MKRKISYCIEMPVMATILCFLVLLSANVAKAGSPDSTKQKLFASAEEARNALVDAARSKDQAALSQIFGPSYGTLLSGDATEDSHELDQFAAALDKSANLEKVDDRRFSLAIGEHNWPFPIPIVKDGSQWGFDTAAGMEEILNRRIGENELSAIATCRAYVLAQWEYFTEGDLDNDGVAEYAQRFYSTPGHKDGLYWETAGDEKPSPMGQLVAAARAEGYPAGRGRATASGTSAVHNRSPYHGYYFKILKRQGPHAPGGTYNYVINGNMIAGYALIAYPAKWGSSGIMTFIVNQQGRVYQKNLGPGTAKTAATITGYDPGPSWKLVHE